MRRAPLGCVEVRDDPISMSVHIGLNRVISCAAQGGVDPLSEERAAISALEKKHATITRNAKLPNAPVVAVSFDGPIDDGEIELLFTFPQLERLNFDFGNPTDAGFSRLAKLSTIRTLCVNRATVSENALRQIAKLSQLRYLSLGCSKIDEAGLVHLAELRQLEWLWLDGSSIDDGGLIQLHRLASVRSIDLSDTNVSESSVAKLKEALPYAIVDQGGRGRAIPDHFSEFMKQAAILALIGVSVSQLPRWRMQAVRRRPLIWKGIVVVTFIAIISVGLSRFAKAMYPLTDGDPGEFWIYACRIDVGAKHPGLPRGSFRLPRDGVYIYYFQHIEGEAVFQVPASECEAMFPKLVERLKMRRPAL